MEHFVDSFSSSAFTVTELVVWRMGCVSDAAGQALIYMIPDTCNLQPSCHIALRVITSCEQQLCRQQANLCADLYKSTVELVWLLLSLRGKCWHQIRHLDKKILQQICYQESPSHWLLPLEVRAGGKAEAKPIGHWYRKWLPVSHLFSQLSLERSEEKFSENKGVKYINDILSGKYIFKTVEKNSICYLQNTMQNWIYVFFIT